jgi:hypothetical protein
MRRLAGAAVLVGGPLLLVRRRRAARRGHVDLHFGDGSTVTLEAGSPDADALLTIVRQAL